MVYYCRNCGYEDITLNIMGGCIVEREYSQEYQVIKHLVNQYTKYDVTLPRMHHLLCPNGACESNLHKKRALEQEEKRGAGATGAGHDDDDSAAQKHEVIYLRYDEKKMKYLYICCTCNATWKNK